MKRALPLVLLGAAAVLVLLMAVFFVANNFLGPNNAPDLIKWTAPLQLVDSKTLTPGAGLSALTGVPSSEAIDNDLMQGNWDAAFADIAYSPDLDDANRAGKLLLLGSRYATAKQTDKAVRSYQYASTVVTLSPMPSDLVRAQTLLQAALGLDAIQAHDAARSTLDQAFLITQYAPSIPRDARARLYSQIGTLYASLGQTALANQARQKGQEESAATEQDSELTTRVPFRLQGPAMAKPDDLKQLIDERVNIAKELVDDISLHTPKTEKDLPDNLVQDLADKLFQEDGARQSYYETMANSAKDPTARAAVLQDESNWLALKLRVARRGFGVSLVSEWESDADAIAQALSDKQDELFQLSEEEAAQVDDTVEADRRAEDVLRSELVAIRWGLYQFDENDVASRLKEATQKLRDDSVSALRLDSFERNKALVYLLVPDDLYGKGEKALPK